jgi:hypothetical protein
MTNDDVHEDRARVIVDAFLQNKSMEQKQDYLARGRRFGKLDVAQLNEGWIMAVGSWLAHKSQRDELLMDDLASELRLRRLEPPYRAVEQELADRFIQADGSKREEKIRNVVQEIYDFMNKNERHSTSS